MKKSLFLFLVGSILPAMAQENIFPNPEPIKTISAEHYRSLPGTDKTGETTPFIPAHFGVYLEKGTKAKWGFTKDEKFGGGGSCFFRYLPDDPGDGKKWRYNMLILGNDNRFRGSNAFRIKPNTDYVYSYYIKGNLDMIDPLLIFWPEEKADDSRARIDTRKGLNRRIPLSETWRRHSGYFRTPDNAGYMALALSPSLGKPRDAFWIAQIKVAEIPAVIKRETASRKFSVGVYNVKGKENIQHWLKQKKIPCELVNTLKNESINKYNILFLPDLKKLNPADAGNLDMGIPPMDFASALLNFVDGGGTLIMDRGVLGFHSVFETSMLTSDDSGLMSGRLSRGKLAAYDFSGTEPKTLEQFVRLAEKTTMYVVPPELTDATLGDQYLRRSIGISSQEKARRKKELIDAARLPAPHFDEKIIWCDSTYLKNDAQVATLMENCRKLGFTKVLFQANQGYFLFYKSRHFPDSEMIWRKRYNFDVLKSAAEHAEKNGLKFSVYIAGFKQFFPAPGIDPEITAADRVLLDSGAVTMKHFTDRTEKELYGVRWMCPGSPSNQQRLRMVCKEIIEQFKPDEIVFDFVRYSLGYEVPCVCDRCLKAKAAFAAAHLKIAPTELDREFARSEITALYSNLIAECKKLSPKVLTGCYTMSSTETPWVLALPFDRHYKYVSTRLSPETPMSDVRDLTIKFQKLFREHAPKVQFIPMLSSYDFKSGERLYAECAHLSSVLNELKMPKVMLYYTYATLCSDRVVQEKVNPEIAPGLSRALGGAWK